LVVAVMVDAPLLLVTTMFMPDLDAIPATVGRRSRQRAERVTKVRVAGCGSTRPKQAT